MADGDIHTAITDIILHFPSALEDTGAEAMEVTTVDTITAITMATTTVIMVAEVITPLSIKTEYDMAEAQIFQTTPVAEPPQPESLGQQLTGLF